MKIIGSFTNRLENNFRCIAASGSEFTSNYYCYSLRVFLCFN